MYPKYHTMITVITYLLLDFMLYFVIVFIKNFPSNVTSTQGVSNAKYTIRHLK